MALEIQGVAPDPTLDQVSTDGDGRQQRVIVYSGEVTVAPPQGGGFSVAVATGRGPSGSLGLYLPDTEPFAAGAEVTAWAEISLAVLTIHSGGSAVMSHGVGQATVQLVPDQSGSGARWPYLGFSVYGTQPLVARYRVTAVQRADPAVAPH